VVFNSTASPYHSGQHHQRQGNSRNYISVPNLSEKSDGGSGENSEVRE
jgi:hypothetical protein